MPSDTFPKGYFAADLIHLLVGQKEPPRKDGLEATSIAKRTENDTRKAYGFSNSAVIMAIHSYSRSRRDPSNS